MLPRISVERTTLVLSNKLTAMALATLLAAILQMYAVGNGDVTRNLQSTSDTKVCKAIRAPRDGCRGKSTVKAPCASRLRQTHKG